MFGYCLIKKRELRKLKGTIHSLKIQVKRCANGPGGTAFYKKAYRELLRENRAAKEVVRSLTEELELLERGVRE